MPRPELNNKTDQTRKTDDASNGERPLRSTEEAEEALERKHKERRRYWAMRRREEAGLDARIADAVARDTR